MKYRSSVSLSQSLLECPVNAPPVPLQKSRRKGRKGYARSAKKKIMEKMVTGAYLLTIVSEPTAIPIAKSIPTHTACLLYFRDFRVFRWKLGEGSRGGPVCCLLFFKNHLFPTLPLAIFPLGCPELSRPSGRWTVMRKIGRFYPADSAGSPS